MRQLFFIALIVGGAFVAGVTLNTTSLKYAQTWLINYMGLKDGGEISSVDLPPISSPGPGEVHPSQTATGSPALQEPAHAGTLEGPSIASGSKNDRTIKLQGPQRKKAKVDPRIVQGNVDLQPQAPSARNAPQSDPRAHGPAQSPGMPSQNGPLSAEQKPAHQAADETAAPSPLHPSVGSALLAALNPDNSVRQANHARDAIPLEVSPSPASQPGSQPSSTLAGGHEEWTSLRQRLQKMGVTHYSIEGSPNGRVVFSCLIPLVSHQAVSERFEAEGDDEFDAIHNAIRSHHSQADLPINVGTSLKSLNLKPLRPSWWPEEKLEAEQLSHPRRSVQVTEGSEMMKRVAKALKVPGGQGCVDCPQPVRPSARALPERGFARHSVTPWPGDRAPESGTC